MLHHSIRSFLPEIQQLLRNHKVKNAFVFGSAVSEKFNDKSDLDIIVNLEDGLDPIEAGENLWSLTFQLEDLTHRKVDLLTERSLKNPIFIAEVNSTKHQIYG